MFKFILPSSQAVAPQKKETVSIFENDKPAPPTESTASKNDITTVSGTAGAANQSTTAAGLVAATSSTTGAPSVSASGALPVTTAAVPAVASTVVSTIPAAAPKNKPATVTPPNGKGSTKPAVNAPTGQTAAGSSKLAVDYLNINATTPFNTIQPKIWVTNKTSSPIDLQDVSIRYYFTADGDAAQNIWIDDCSKGMKGISASIVKLPTAVKGADHYIDIRFNRNAGALMPDKSVIFQIRVSKEDWSNYDQSNDFSYDANTTCHQTKKIACFIAGHLVWGSTP